MQVVINIPDGYKDLDYIRNGSIASRVICDAVKKGTILPKGHGRLIDADALKEDIKQNTAYEPYEQYEFFYELDYTPTVVEADNAESEN